MASVAGTSVPEGRVPDGLVQASGGPGGADAHAACVDVVLHLQQDVIPDEVHPAEYLGLNDSTQTLANRLATYLVAYKHYVQIYSKARLPDVAIFGEPLARDIAEIVFGYTDLVNLNLETSFPAVDLGSPAEACAIQVTISGSTSKIVETQEKFFAHGLDGIYSRLNFIILGEKQATYDSQQIVRSRGAFTFDPDHDIYDLDDLFGILVAKADPAKFEAFADRLQRELGSPTRPYAS